MKNFTKDFFKNVKENIILEYVVFKENTLGYLFKSGMNIKLGVLHGSVIKGGLNWLNGTHTVSDTEFSKIRKATKSDFDHYRVSTKGHLNE